MLNGDFFPLVRTTIEYNRSKLCEKKECGADICVRISEFVCAYNVYIVLIVMLSIEKWLLKGVTMFESEN